MGSFRRIAGSDVVPIPIFSMIHVFVMASFSKAVVQ